MRNLINEHAVLCNDLHQTYIQKNQAYGDSFGKQFREFGEISSLIRMTDKYERIKNLILHSDTKTGDESLIDSLVDLSNYCLMTVMELQARK